MNELNYLIELAKLNIENAKLSLQILFGLTTIVAFAFIGAGFFSEIDLKLRYQLLLYQPLHKMSSSLN